MDTIIRFHLEIKIDQCLAHWATAWLPCFVSVNPGFIIDIYIAWKMLCTQKVIIPHPSLPSGTRTLQKEHPLSVYLFFLSVSKALNLIIA